MLRLENIILEMVARGEALAATADRLCREVEAMVPRVVCSVLTVDRQGLLHPLAGKSLPPALVQAVDGVAIGPAVGSCGTAIYLREPVTVSDIATDPRWAPYKFLLDGSGLAACWSSPILDGHGAAIGAFAFYYHERRGPTEMERAIVSACVHLLAIAIERHERVLEREWRASRDPLTGLGNRASFNAALAELACAEPGRWALLIADLDNLKSINDTFGHRIGDMLIRIVGERISAVAAPDRAFRIGGDEFAVIVQAPDALRDLAAAADRIIAAVAQPAECLIYHIMPGATIGGAVLAPGDLEAEAVRQNADYALYHAKELGRGGFVRYWPGIGSTIANRADAIREVEEALRDHRIDAHYQPIVSLDTGKIRAFEALCRLTTPRGEVLPAAAFHQATCDAQIASALTRRMLEIVARDIERWHRLGIRHPLISVNVTSADIHGGTLESALISTFEATGVSLSHLVIEVTESVHMEQRAETVSHVLENLRHMGLRVALDDFGTGYASLTHLLAVPVDFIKIDRSFIRRLEPLDQSAAIVDGLIAIAQALGIKVVAEGIETEAQLKQLQAYGCAYGQGYLFSRAVDRERATALLLSRTPLDAGIASAVSHAGRDARPI